MWPYWLITGSMAGAGLGLAVWALTWDRSRGRARCPRCWYEIRDVGAGVCSECGRVLLGRRVLHRTRRRWRAAAAGLALVGLVAVTDWGRRNQDALIRLVPTRYLLGRLPDLSAQSDLYLELTRRVEAGELDAEEWDEIFARCLPSTPLETVELTTRPRWPVDHAVHFSVDMTREWTGFGLVDVRPFAVTLGSGTAGAGTYAGRFESYVRFYERDGQRTWPWFDDTFTAGVPARGASLITVEVDVAIECEWGTGAMPRTMRTRSIDVPVEIAGTLDELIRPVRSEPLDRWLEDALVCHANDHTFWFNVHWRRPYPLDRPVAIAFDVELWCGADLVASGPAWRTTAHVGRWIGRGPRVPNQGAVAFFGGRWDRRVERTGRPGRAGPWRVRLTGRRELALRDFGATEAWEGSVELDVGWVKRRSSDGATK